MCVCNYIPGWIVAINEDGKRLWLASDNVSLEGLLELSAVHGYFFIVFSPNFRLLYTLPLQEDGSSSTPQEEGSFALRWESGWGTKHLSVDECNEAWSGVDGVHDDGDIDSGVMDDDNDALEEHEMPVPCKHSKCLLSTMSGMGSSPCNEETLWAAAARRPDARRASTRTEAMHVGLLDAE